MITNRNRILRFEGYYINILDYESNNVLLELIHFLWAVPSKALVDDMYYFSNMAETVVLVYFLKLMKLNPLLVLNVHEKINDEVLSRVCLWVDGKLR